MLRRILLILGSAAFVAGVLLIAAGAAFPAGLYLVGMGAILTLALLFEHRGYRPHIDHPAGDWQKTDERFIDPTSGHVIEVLYNPETGERNYVDTGSTE